MATNSMAATAIGINPDSPDSMDVVLPANLESLAACGCTSLAAKIISFPNDPQKKYSTRLCRLCTKNREIGIYMMADPIGESLLASDISVNTVIEKLSDIDLNDKDHLKQIKCTLENLPYEIDDRLLKLTFDQAETEKSHNSQNKDAEKKITRLEEATSGASIFTVVITPNHLQIMFVGIIRAFIISKNPTDGELEVCDHQPQFYRSGTLHTIENGDEQVRLRNIGINLERARKEGLDSRSSKHTRCIGKIADKFFPTSLRENDLDGSLSQPLTCESRYLEFKVDPKHFALVLMTEDVFQMCMRTGFDEGEVPSYFIKTLKENSTQRNLSQSILECIEEQFNEKQSVTTNGGSRSPNALLIHFFKHTSSDPSSPNHEPMLTLKTTKEVFGEVSVDEVRYHIRKQNQMQQRRDLKFQLSIGGDVHTREEQFQKDSIEPFVKFNLYKDLISGDQAFQQKDNYIADLLWNGAGSKLDDKLKEYLEDVN